MKGLKIIFGILIFPALACLFYYVGLYTMGENFIDMCFIEHLSMIFFGLLACGLVIGIVVLVGMIAHFIYDIIFN